MADYYRQGSFRGVEFEYIEDDYAYKVKEAGQNLLADDETTETLAAAPREFALTVAVCGRDAVKKRNDLIKALEDTSAGILVHPQYGEISVKVSDAGFNVHSAADSGNWFEFVINFIKTNDNGLRLTVVPVSERAEQKHAEAVNRAAQTLSGKAKNNIQVKGWLDTVADDTAALADKVLNEVKTLLEKEILPTGALEKIKGSIDTMSGGILSLINAPDVWALEIMDLLDIDGASFDLYERLAALSVKPSKPQYLTETRKRSVQNQENVLTLFKTAAVLQGLNKGVLMETPSDLQTAERIERMTALTESVTDADAEMQQAFETVLQTSVAVLKSIKKERTKQITAAETIPAVVLLHQTGGTALMRKNEDFVPRNHIRHPLFVAGGLITEVIDV